MSNLTPRIDRLEQSTYGSEIEVAKISAPFTTIVNEQGQPRQISDLANNMKVSMGVERIHFYSLADVEDEFGPNGEIVKRIANGDERIRFIGSNWANNSGSDGTRILKLNNGTPFTSFEVTYYGTGLNLVTSLAGTNFNIDQVTDGGAPVSVLSSYNGSTVLATKNHYANQILPITSGLSLGIHTTRIICDLGTFSFNGIEIVNESSLIAINPGKPRFNSKTQELSSQVLTSYNSGFDDLSDTLGTKGGRVVVYQALDGSINKRLTAVDPAITGNPSAPELVTNGDFSVDTSGWTAVNTNAVVSSGVVTLDDVAPYNSRFHQSITTEVGKTYQIEVQAIGGSWNWFIDFEGAAVKQIQFATTTTYEFTATGVNTTIGFNSGSGIERGTMQIDNISVKEVGYLGKALADTDHSNEEVIRKINWREFGANRSDDFNTLAASASNRGFTLDDGTTTLFGSNQYADTGAGGEGGLLAGTAAGNFTTLTFVGTGLDVVILDNTSNTQTTDMPIIIDNVQVGTIPASTLNNNSKGRVKIASGLPYGTHTVKFLRDVTTTFIYIDHFLIYGPKKPELSQDELELAEYNIVANYSSQTTEFTPSPGTIFKAPHREFIYTGTWEAYELSVTEFATGILIRNSTGTGESFEYTFFGTGIELYGRGGSASPSIQLQIDGVNYTGAADVSSGSVWTPGSSIWQPSTSFGERINISGLPLGIHTIKGTVTANPGQFAFTGCGVITPIHVNSTSLKIGSLGINDLRQAVDVISGNKNKVDLTRAKAWLYYDQVNSKILSSYNISSVLAQSTGTSLIYFKYPFKDTNYIIIATPTEDPFSADNGYTIQVRNLKTKNSCMLAIHDVDSSITVTNKAFYAIWYGELENEEDLDLGDL